VQASDRHGGRRRGGRARPQLLFVRAALLVALVLVPGRGARAAERDFPTPPALAPAVRFWVDVFTRWSTDDVVLHDRFLPGVVYGVVHGADPVRVASEVQRVGDRLTLATLLAPDGVRRALFLDEAPLPADTTGPGRLRLQRGLREAFAGALAAQRLYRPVVEQALAAEGLPHELAALPLIESSYLPGAVSEADAVGLWQLTRGAARGNLRVAGSVDERRDPARASEAAARYLRTLRDAFPSWPLALSAYNRGPAGVARARRALGSDDLGLIVTHYHGDGFGFATRSYYAQFLAALHVMRHPRAYFPDLPRQRVVEYRVKPGDTLSGLARRHGVSLGTLRVTNGLRSAALQPGQRLLIRL
jgi:membrane-bound lytic murein transglycosylase D